MFEIVNIFSFASTDDQQQEKIIFFCVIKSNFRLCEMRGWDESKRSQGGWLFSNFYSLLMGELGKLNLISPIFDFSIFLFELII